MAHQANRPWSAEHMCYADEIGWSKKCRAVKLQDATEEDIKEFYKNWNNLKEEFEKTRPNFYMTEGTWEHDPLLAHYKYFLQDKEIQYISI